MSTAGTVANISIAGSAMLPTCNYCGMWHATICPRIRVIEYYNDGSVKRVELTERAQPGLSVEDIRAALLRLADGSVGLA